MPCFRRRPISISTIVRATGPRSAAGPRTSYFAQATSTISIAAPDHRAKPSARTSSACRRISGRSTSAPTTRVEPDGVSARRRAGRSRLDAERATGRASSRGSCREMDALQGARYRRIADRVQSRGGGDAEPYRRDSRSRQSKRLWRHPLHAGRLRAEHRITTLYRSRLSLPLPQHLRAAAFDGRNSRSPTRLTPLRRRCHCAIGTARNSSFAARRVALNLEDDAPLKGPRAIFLTDIMNPCWIWRGADLNGIAGIEAGVGQVPFNFEIGHDRDKILLHPPATPSGELEIHLDSCDGPKIATCRWRRPFPTCRHAAQRATSRGTAARMTSVSSLHRKNSIRFGCWTGYNWCPTRIDRQGVCIVVQSDAGFADQRLGRAARGGARSGLRRAHLWAMASPSIRPATRSTRPATARS